MGASRSYTFIVNPTAGKGAGARFSHWLKEQLPAEDPAYRIEQTESNGHATKLAASAESDVVVAVGGDGTINEVVNGLDVSRKTLGIIPCGSGNDMVRSLEIPKTPSKALAIALRGKTKAIDFGRVFYADKLNSIPQSLSSRLFCNGVGIGFDAAVAEQARHIGFFRGLPLYVVAVFRTLGRYRAPIFAIRSASEEIAMRCLLIAIGNGKSAGGGFYLTPTAKMDDGILDVCIIPDKSLFGILTIMPKTMRGSHGMREGVRFQQIERVTIESESAFCVHTDGEVVGSQIKRTVVEVIKSGLKVIVP